jgi:hypothetical protein
MIRGDLALDVVCNGAFTGSVNTTSFTAQANKGPIRVMNCTASTQPAAIFNGKQVVRPDGLHLYITGGRFTKGTVVCSSPILPDRTEQLTGRPINPTDIKVETVSEGKITGSQWLANPLVDAVLAEVFAANPDAEIETTSTGHWELIYQGP